MLLRRGRQAGRRWRVHGHLVRQWIYAQTPNSVSLSSRSQWWGTDSTYVANRRTFGCPPICSGGLPPYGDSRLLTRVGSGPTAAGTARALFRRLTDSRECTSASAFVGTCSARDTGLQPLFFAANRNQLDATRPVFTPCILLTFEREKGDSAPATRRSRGWAAGAAPYSLSVTAETHDPPMVTCGHGRL